MAVDVGLAPPDGPPEVVDVRREGAAHPEVERQHPAARRRDRHGARALGRLARGARAVPRDVRGDDDRHPAVGGAGGDPLARRQQRRRAAVAGVLDVEDPRLAGEPDEPVHEGRDGLRRVHAGLGADGEEPHARRIEPARREQPLNGGGGERDGVLAGIGHGHLAGAEPDGELRGLDAPEARERLDGQVAPRQGHGQRFDPDVR